MAARRPPLTDDADGDERGSRSPAPLLQQFGDRPVKMLVGRVQRLREVGVDLAEGGGLMTGCITERSPTVPSRARLAVG